MSQVHNCTEGQAAAFAAFIAATLSTDRLIWVDGKKYRVKDASEGKTKRQIYPHIIQTKDGFAVGSHGSIFAFVLEPLE